MPEILGSSLAEHRECTRTALFQALSKLISQRSFDKITLSDVANHAGVGRMAVYNHSVNKEDLFLAFVEYEIGRYAEEFSRAPAGTQDPIDHLRIHVRQQALIAWHFHSPISGPLFGAVSCGTAGRLKAHGALVAQTLSSTLTDAMGQGSIPVQELEQVIPLIYVIVMSGRPTPSDPEQRRAYLESLDVFVLRTAGARRPAYTVSTIAQPCVTKPLEGTQAPGSLRHSAAD